MRFSNYISIKNEKAEATIISLLLFHLSVIAINPIYFSTYTNLLTLLGFVTFAYCIVNIQKIVDFGHLYANIFLIIFGSAMFYSNTTPVEGLYVSTRANITQVFQYVLPFFALQVLCQKGYLDKTMRALWKISVFYVVVTDLHAVLTGAKAIGLIGGYLVGNKFSLCYLHFYMLGFFMYFADRKKKSDNIKLILMYVLSIIISIYSECSTALIALVFFLGLYYFKDRILPFLQKSVIALGLIVISNIVLIVFPAVLTWGPLNYLIVNVLGEDPSLTGRMVGYTRMVGALLYNPVWGVGYYSKYYISKYFTNMDDLQNGLADVALAFGIVGVVLLMVLIVLTLKIGAGKKSLGFLFIMYMFIVISSVEITLNYKFVIILALVMVCRKEEMGEIINNENSNIINAKNN